MALLRSLLVAVFALAAGVALACGPTRQKAANQIEINVPADRVWAVIGDYGDMGWHPLVAKTEVTGAVEPDTAKRTLTFQGGGVITDTLIKINAGERTIGFRTDEADQSVLPVTGYSSTLIVHEVAPGRASVEWRGAFSRGYLKADPPPELNDDAAMQAVSAYQRQGLAALKAKLEGAREGG